ncbi:MAG TPA: hypothetical protein VD999_01615 [Vitreimonas sp.]|nr:hypothetical protein [Vitreimonas sp.]
MVNNPSENPHRDISLKKELILFFNTLLKWWAELSLSKSTPDNFRIKVGNSEIILLRTERDTLSLSLKFVFEKHEYIGGIEIDTPELIDLLSSQDINLFLTDPKEVGIAPALALHLKTEKKSPNPRSIFGSTELLAAILIRDYRVRSQTKFEIVCRIHDREDRTLKRINFPLSEHDTEVLKQMFKSY